MKRQKDEFTLGYVEFEVTARFPGRSRVKYSGLEIRRERSGFRIKVWDSSTYGDYLRRGYEVNKSEGLGQSFKESRHLMDEGRRGTCGGDGESEGY